MAIVISLFNHKGGVGKTTFVSTLGWALSKQGQKVLLLDLDPQSNLTQFFCDEEVQEKLENDYATVYNVFASSIMPFEKEVDRKPFHNVRENLDLCAGSITFAELDNNLTLALSGLSSMERIPSQVLETLTKMGANYDFVLLDLSPSLSPVNELFLMLSHYFISPVFPGLYSLNALKNLGIIFRRWNSEMQNPKFKLKAKLPQFLGIIFQNFRPYTKADEVETKSARRFKADAEKLNDQANKLALDLNGFGMAVSKDRFIELFGQKNPYKIVEIPDYNQLKIVAEKNQRPVAFLDNKMLNEEGLNIPQYQEKRDEYLNVITELSGSLLKLKENA